MNRRLRFVGTLALSGYAALLGCQGKVAVAAPLATGETDVRAIASDDFFVYWVTFSGFVKRVSLDGGHVETLATGQAGPQAMTLDAAYVYFASGDGTIARVPKKGGDVKVLAQGVNVQSLVTDDTYLYFTTPSSVESVLKDSIPEILPAKLAENLVKKPGALALAGTLVFTNGVANAAISQVDVNGGTPSALVGGAGDARELSVSPTGRMAWTEAGDMLSPSPVVRSAALDGSDVHVLAQLDASEQLDSVVLDEKNAYFSTNKGTVRVASLQASLGSNEGASGAGGAGSGPDDVMLQGPGGGSVKLAIDASSIYVANGKDGAILALHKRVDPSE